MFENKRKGWHGAYSMTGKMTAEQFNEILHKDNILNGSRAKKLKIKDIFEPDQVTNNLDFLYDNINSFQIYLKEDKNFTESLSKTVEDGNKNIESNKIKNLKTFFYKKPNKEKDAFENKFYEPKYDLIFSKTLTGIKWNKLPGRKKPPMNIDIIDNGNTCKKYIKDTNKNYPVTPENKCFVNMDNYTKRGNFIELKDIRMRYDKPFNKQQDINSKTSENYTSNQSNSISTLNNNKNKIRNIFFGQSKLSKKRKTNLLLKQSFSEKIQIPNFKKYLSRQYLEKLRRKKGFEKNNYLSFLSLNYDINHEKKSSDVKFNHKKNKNKVNKFIGINSISLSNYLQNIDKYNNHSSSKVINLKLMPSRSYYENIKNNKIDKPSDHLSPSYSSFYKHSFNNIINLKLLNSIFFEKKANNKIRNNINKIKNKMIFNNKTYRQLIQENEINKLDGITLKSLKRKKEKK